MRLPQSIVCVIFIVSLSTATERARRDAADGDAVSGLPLDGQTFTITTVEQVPYLYVGEDTTVGNAQFTGYMPDLLYKLKQKLGFEYTLKLQPDGRYGSRDKDGKWNGMIGAVAAYTPDPSDESNVAMAAAGITITKQREMVVDFIQPFAHVGLSVLIQKPHMRTKDAPEPKPWHFNFDVFKPLAAEVWVLVTAIMIVVWLFFWLMNCFNPYEYGERYKRNLATEDQANLFTFTGSLWFTFTTLQWQGYDRAPRSVASKIMGCFWMVFITLTIVTYISSFVNHMFWASTVHMTDPTIPPVRDLADLVDHVGDYQYGTVSGGSTFQYLTQVARGSEFNKMAKYFNTTVGQKQLVNATDMGIEKARLSKYAFIGETMAIRHAISSAPQCDLMDLGILFGMRSYGLAISEKLPHKEAFDQAILEMIETGDIDALEEKWFNDYKCKQTTAQDKALSQKTTMYLDKPRRVTLHMFWSPIVLIVVGIVLSLAVGVTEILWYKYRGRYDANNRQRGQQLTNEDDGHI